ncbi:MAG: acyl carrier protein [Coriobacteriia bacterium]|nr:acyl carrier protein [Coriobacteriia bacterium]
MSTLDTIKDILKEKQDIDPASVNENSTFEDLKIDSLDLVEMVCELEDRMKIDFGDPEGLKTIGDVVKYVDAL